jgi:hypothetical protein
MKKILILLFMVVNLLNCQKDQSPIIAGKYTVVPISEDYFFIRSPLIRWRAYHINNYVVKQTISGFLPFSGKKYKLIIRENTIYQVYDLETNQYVKNPPPFLNTIDGLFDYIWPINPNSVAYYKVDYDKKLGYPIFIHILLDTTVVDAGFSIRTEFINKIEF